MIDTILFDLVGVLLFPNADYEQDSLVDEIDQLVGAVTAANIMAAQQLGMSAIHWPDRKQGFQTFKRYLRDWNEPKQLDSAHPLTRDKS